MKEKKRWATAGSGFSYRGRYTGRMFIRGVDWRGLNWGLITVVLLTGGFTKGFDFLLPGV